MVVPGQEKITTQAQGIQQLRALGFSDDKMERPRRLVASVDGREKTGKTHFALTALRYTLHE